MLTNEADYPMGPFIERIKSDVASGSMTHELARIALAHAARDRNLKESDIDELLQEPIDTVTIGVESDRDDEAPVDEIDSRLAAFPQTDLGNAERLAARFGDQIRFCYVWGKWLIWDGRRWSLDQAGTIHRLAGVTARKILDEAATLEEKSRKEMNKWRTESEFKQRIEAMIFLCRSLEEIPVDHEELDRDPWSLNVLNGTLDLKTGELREHRREDLLASLAPVEYLPEALCPLWESTLSRIFDGNKALIQFWQRLCGRCLTADVSEQILPILYGSGANGKSTILLVLLDLLGPDYAASAPPGLLVARRGEAHPTERTILFRKRLVVDVESAEGAVLNENLVKQLTGGDKIVARKMREDFWAFSPTHKLFMATNHKPTIKETKSAIWRRIKLIPFLVKIPEEEQDKDLTRKLKAEYPGILAWCLRGLADCLFNGLQPPDEVERATAAYRADQDTLGDFLEEECVANPELNAPATPLYQRYQKWAERSGESAMTQKAFGSAMTEKGFLRRTSNGIWYQGIGLRQSSSDGSHCWE